MAKARPNNQFLGIRTSGIGKFKLIVCLSVVALLWWIVTDPVGAAAKVTMVVRAVLTFVSSLRG